MGSETRERRLRLEIAPRGGLGRSLEPLSTRVLPLPRSKMRGVSGITFNGEEGIPARTRHRKHSHDVSSDTSVGSNDSVDNYGDHSNDEVSGHEIKQLWASSYDLRHPVRNVVDRNSATFWMSSGLFPQNISNGRAGPHCQAAANSGCLPGGSSGLESSPRVV